MTKGVNRCQVSWASELAGNDFKMGYCPRNLNGKLDAVSRRLEYCPEKGGSSETGLQPISLELKPEHFISEILQEGIGIRTVISLSKLHIIPPIKFNADFMEGIVTAGVEDQE
jgi:hypothetical protein